MAKKSHGKIRFANPKLVAIDTLKQHPKNPNRHTEAQIAAYAAILKAQGVRQPVRVSKRSKYVTKGHGQLLASAKNGWTHVPVEYQDYDSEEQEYADLVADNALAKQADIDFGMVNAEVPNLGPDFDIGLLAIQGFKIDPAEAGREVRFTVKPGSKEYGEEQFQKFAHKCPRCSFEFNKPA